MSEKMTRDEWYKWVRENPEKCTIDVLADALHPTGADMAIEDGEHHPDLARALKGRNPLDSRHNVVGELIQQLDYVGIGIHMQARREALLECAKLAVTIAETRAPDYPGDDKLGTDNRNIMTGHVLGCLTIRDLILELAGVEFEVIDGHRVVKNGSSLEEAVRNLVKGNAGDDRR